MALKPARQSGQNDENGLILIEIIALTIFLGLVMVFVFPLLETGYEGIHKLRYTRQTIHSMQTEIESLAQHAIIDNNGTDWLVIQFPGRAVSVPGTHIVREAGYKSSADPQRLRLEAFIPNDAPELP